MMDRTNPAGQEASLLKEFTIGKNDAGQRLDRLHSGPGLTRKLKQVKAVGLLSLAMAGFVLLTFLLTCVTRVSDLSLLCLPILGTYCVVLAVVMRSFSRLF